MPAANYYTTKEAQYRLVHHIQKPLVDTVSALFNPKSLWQWAKLAWSAWQIIRQIRKLRYPTQDMVNKHNAKVMIAARDWFLEHEALDSPRRKFFEGFLSFVPIKYDIDDFMSKRLDEYLYKLLELGYVFHRKPPETYWVLGEEDKQRPTVKRMAALREALHAGEYAKVLNLID